MREREQHEWKGGKGERRIMRSSRYGELDSTPLPPKKKAVEALKSVSSATNVNPLSLAGELIN